MSSRCLCFPGCAGPVRCRAASNTAPSAHEGLGMRAGRCVGCSGNYFPCRNHGRQELWCGTRWALVCVGEHPPFSCVERAECFPNGSRCNPLQGLPGAARLRLRRGKGDSEGVVVDPAVGGEVCGAASRLGIARVAADFMDIHHWRSRGWKQVLQRFSPAGRL